MEINERIRSNVSGKTYTVTWVSDTVTQAEVGFAKTDSEGEVYFIKRLLNMRYPLDSSPGSPKLKAILREKYDKHFTKYSSLYSSIHNGCGETGACVPILDYFREGTFFYTVYRKIHADSLSLLEISSLPENEKFKLLLRLVQGLQPMHTLGVIHGDLKPDNILVQQDGDTWRIRLIDMTDCYRAGEPNEPGAVVGTPDYYSPELTKYNTYEIEDWDDEDEMKMVLDMASNLTTNSDIFALGIIFHEFYTGTKPTISDDTIKYICEAALKGKLIVSSSIPDQLRSLITSMLNPDFDKRPTLGQVGNLVRSLIVGGHVTEPNITIVHIKDDIYGITMDNEDPEVEIYYTLNGTIPTKGSLKYEKQLELKKHTQIRAICIKGKRKSNIVLRSAWVKTQPLIISRPPKIIVHGRNITIKLNDKSPELSKIYYTTDDSTPTISSKFYESSFDVDESVKIIKAVVLEPGSKVRISEIAQANVYKMKVSAPVLRKEFLKNVFYLSSNEGHDIYYTLDGTIPDIKSTKYSAPFTVDDEDAFHIRAVCINSEGTTSEISELKKTKSGVKMKFKTK